MSSSSLRAGFPRPYIRSKKDKSTKSYKYDSEEFISVDYSKDPNENVKDLLSAIVKQNVGRAKKIAYYNGFARFCYRQFQQDLKYQWQMKNEEILLCLRVGLVHECKEIRTAALRAVRYYIRTENDIKVMIQQHMDYLIARCLDSCLSNDIERMHALRLIRKIVHISPQCLPPSLMNVMVAIISDGVTENDKMVKTCLSTVCELAFYNPALVSECGGISGILRNVLDSHQFPRVNESLLVSILYLLNHPSTRKYIKQDVDLEQLLAPFTDSHYRYQVDIGETSLAQERENRYAASKLAIGTIIKSWPGLIRLCKPDGTGLQSMIGILYLPNMRTRDEIMDIMFDVFRYPVPAWTSNFHEALESIDPCNMRDQWKITEGFVAEEGKSLLRHLSRTRPNLVENHMALILSSFICAGVLEALVNVIVSSDECTSTRATFLLGEVLNMANAIIPYENSHHSHCLPNLIAMSTDMKVAMEKRQTACAAISHLKHFHTMKTRKLRACSLYLQQILECAMNSPCSVSKQSHTDPLSLPPEKLVRTLPKESDQELFTTSLKDSLVLHVQDYRQWGWRLIIGLLKWRGDHLKRMDDQNVQKFLRRLLHFYKPTNDLFSVIDVSTRDCDKYSVAALYLIDLLVSCDNHHTTSEMLILEWLEDMKQCLSQIRSEHVSSEAYFAPSHLSSRLCQNYFLFIGRFSMSKKGRMFLEKTGIFQYLQDIVTVSSHDTYIKLIISTLDYTHDGMARHIFSKAITATSESARLYTANLLRVFLRAGLSYMSTWGMEMLVTQIYDQTKAVAMAALTVISEACEQEINLHTLIKMKPAVLHLGHKGAMLLARFLSIPAGYRSFLDANYVQHELDKWHTEFNVKYVHIVEERLNEALTTYECTYDGSYTRRSHDRQPRKDVYVPIHLYGQLVQHEPGFKLLEAHPCMQEYKEVIQTRPLTCDKDVVQLKAALWAMGHASTSKWGARYLKQSNLLPDIIKLAEESAVFSIRGTAFYVLGLVANTCNGADLLHDYGWEAVRHKHNDLWPVINLSEPQSEADVTMDTITTTTSTSSLPSIRDPSPQHSTNNVFYLDGENGQKSRCNTRDSGVSDMRSEVKVEPKITIDALVPPSCEQLQPGIGFVSETDSGSVSDNEIVHHSDPGDSTTHEENDKNTLNTIAEISDTHRQEVTEEINTIKNKLNKQLTSDHSQDSSRTSKSDSVMADSVTSGFSSYESSTAVGPASDLPNGPLSESPTHVNANDNSSVTCVVISDDAVSLNSTNTISSAATDVSTVVPSATQSLVHPSDTLRRMMNLKRVPSLRRRYSNPSMGHFTTANKCNGTVISDEKEGCRLSNGVMSVYTTPRNAQGYATLRELQRHRAQSMEYDSQQQKHHIQRFTSMYDDYSTVNKTKSLDFRRAYKRPKNRPRRKTLPTLSISNMLCGGGRGVENSSMTSLHSMDNSPLTPPTTRYNTLQLEVLPRNVSKDDLMSQKPKLTGRPDYIGLCVPVDITMMFQVHEGEDNRCQFPEEPVAMTTPQGFTPTRTLKPKYVGLNQHCIVSCIGCYYLGVEQHAKEQAEHMEDDDEILECDLENDSIRSGQTSPLPVTHPSGAGLTSRQTSFTDVRLNLPSSVTSVTSTSSNSHKRPIMNEDSSEGKALIVKEIVRLITHLATSVGVRATEQGLLLLKQKFPTSFQDLCLYSDISNMLATNRYRLTSRKFIQELFQDVDFSKLNDEPCSILGLGIEVLQSPVDEFTDAFDSVVCMEQVGEESNS